MRLEYLIYLGILFGGLWVTAMLALVVRYIHRRLFGKWHSLRRVVRYADEFDAPK